MTESQKELNDTRMKNLKRAVELLPKALKLVRDQAADAYQDGVIDSKTKRLMALAIALGAGCRNCVLGQAMYALEAEATREEFLEVISVVMSMRGTTGLAESLRVILLLDELEKEA